MQVIVNSKLTEVGERSTVSDLLAALGLGGKWVLVERNGEPVSRADFDTTRLNDSDRIELVRAVAGG